MKRLVAFLMCILITLPCVANSEDKEDKPPIVPNTIVGAKELAGPHYTWNFKLPEEKDGENAIDHLVKDEAVTPQTAKRIKEVADQKIKQ